MAKVLSYRNDLNEAFFKLAFDYVIEQLNLPVGGSVLDAGCGSANHTLRLARAGLEVSAIDYSEFILQQAKSRVLNTGFESRISFQQEDLAALSFEDNAFDGILCWGVLMHVPHIETAISSLCRVLKPGGRLVISEVNMYALEVSLRRLLRLFCNKKHIQTKRVASGLEIWTHRDSGDLLSRPLDVSWAVRSFLAQNIKLLDRRSGQFSELYTKFSSKRMQKLVHGFNHLWFKYINMPRLACGNILVFEKQ